MALAVLLAVGLIAAGASLFDFSEDRIAGEEALRELLSIEPAAAPPSGD